MLEKIATRLGISALVGAIDPVSLDMAHFYWYLDASRAEEELGWSPRDPIETLADTVKDLEARGVVWPVHEKSRMKPLLVVNPRSGGGATGRSFGGMKRHRARARSVRGRDDGAARPRRGARARGGDRRASARRRGRRRRHVPRGRQRPHASEGRIVRHESRCRSRRPHRPGHRRRFPETLGIEHRLDKYLDAIASGRERALDVGRFTGGGRRTTTS